MGQYLFQRTAAALATLCVGAVTAFCVFHLLPGDPSAVIAGPSAPHAEVIAIRRQLGLDSSLPSQFASYLSKLAHFNLGRSYVSNVPVTTLLRERVPVTIELIITSLVVALATAGVFALGALRPGGLLDKLGQIWSIIGLSVPSFWTAILLAITFGVELHWLPTSGFVSFVHDPVNALRYSLLPSLTLGLYMSAFLTQFLTSSLRTIMNEDYIRSARARGLSDLRILLCHASKPALIPFVTILGILIGTAVGGTIIIESVFNYPGFGRLFVSSILSRDYYVVQAGILLVVAAVVVANLVVDLAYAFLDPRVRYGGRD